FTEQEPGQVVLVPTRTDDDRRRAGFTSGFHGAGPPVDDALTFEGGHGLLPVRERVVDDDQVAAVADRCTAHTDGLHAAVVAFDAPLVRCRMLRIRADPKHVRPELGENVPHLSTPLPGEAG